MTISKGQEHAYVFVPYPLSGVRLHSPGLHRTNWMLLDQWFIGQITCKEAGKNGWRHVEMLIGNTSGQNVLLVMPQMCVPYEKQFTIQHTHTIHAKSSYVDKNRTSGPVFPWPGKCRHPVEEGFVFTVQDKAVVVPGDSGLREAQHGEGSHTQRKIEGERGIENESGGSGEGGGERERTLPGGSFFLSAIINGILPLTHSSLRQTKGPTFQCSLTASQLATVEPHHSSLWTNGPITVMGSTQLFICDHFFNAFMFRFGLHCYLKTLKPV